MQVFGHLSGGVSLSTPEGDSISVFFSAIDQGGFFGPTGARASSAPGFDPNFVSVTHGGQTFSSSHPGVCGTPPCFSVGLIASMHADPPSPLTFPPTPFTGPFRVTVNGTFSLSVIAAVSFDNPLQDFSVGVGFLSGTPDFAGPASLTFDAIVETFPSCEQFPAPLCGTPRFDGWQFESGFAQIDPTPEPATLLLFGTTAAGLGLGGWRRRRMRSDRPAGLRRGAPAVRGPGWREGRRACLANGLLRGSDRSPG